MAPTAALLAVALLGSPSALTPAGLQERHGIRLDRVAVTAAGGLVDLRFTVVDPSKARTILGSHAMPRLLGKGSDVPLEPPHHGPMRSVRLQPEAACFLLYPNARGAVRAGTEVTVLFGDTRVGPIVAR